MRWQHVTAIAIGGALAIVGALTGTIEVLAPIATTLIGGALGNATIPNGRRTSTTPPEGSTRT